MLSIQDKIKIPNHEEYYLVIDIIYLGKSSYAILQNLDDSEQITILEYICKEDEKNYFIDIEDDNLYEQLLFVYYLSRKKEWAKPILLSLNNWQYQQRFDRVVRGSGLDLCGDT